MKHNISKGYYKYTKSTFYERMKIILVRNTAIQNGIKNNKNGNVWAKIFNDFRNLQ